MIDETRLKQVLAHDLGNGSHSDIDDGMCVMEAAAYVAREPWSDEPQCVCPVIAAFLRSWNDSLPDDEARNRLLRPLIPDMVGSRSSSDVEKRRSYLALDWLIRVYTPRWLDLMPELKAHARTLRQLDEIVDIAGAVAAGNSVRAAVDAAEAAARAAAEDAARAAAEAAARAADRAAAEDALKPTTEWLQQSAVDLVRRMITAG